MFKQTGRQLARVTSSALGFTSKGTEQIAISFKNDDGETGVWYGFFTDASLETTVRALQALGWDPSENGYRFHDLNGTRELVDREAMIVVEEDQDLQGNPINRIRWVNSPDGGLKERMAPDVAEDFSKRLRARLIASGNGGKKPVGAAASQRHEEPPPEDDDIPF